MSDSADYQKHNPEFVWTVGTEFVTDFWQPVVPGTCWVCGDETQYAWLDLGYQHPDCDAFPAEGPDKTTIFVKIVGGTVVSAESAQERENGPRK